jgi:hypothetical protein
VICARKPDDSGTKSNLRDHRHVSCQNAAGEETSSQALKENQGHQLTTMAIKLVVLALQLAMLGSWVWRRLTLGPIADFTGLPGSKTQQISNSTGTAEVHEQCTKYGWPVQVWVQITLRRSRLFELGPQRRFSFSTDLEIGMRGFDETFFIGSESQHFISVLAARSDVRKHFVLLPSRLNRYQSKLVRVRAENGNLAVQCNVRWTKDRPALYLNLLEWLQALDILLAMKPPVREQTAVSS